MKIVSGGQTGVDRAALDAALENGVAAGGWCPEGRMAEDGGIDPKYPLQVLAGAGYPERTRQNVVDSGGTAIIYFGYASGGTGQTIGWCIRKNKPFVLIDAEELPIERASSKIADFLRRFDISVLNVAGPRASGEPRAYAYTHEVMYRVLTRCAEKGPG